MKNEARSLACGALLLAVHAAVAAPLALTLGGKPNAEVVLDTVRPQRQLEYAALELTNWLGRISGAAIPVVKAPGTQPVKLVLGTPDHSPAVAAFAKAHAADFKRLEGNDGFIIRRQGDAIYLAAAEPKGVLNGVYRFLEKNTDIIFVRPLEAENGFGTIYGRNPNLQATFADTLDIPAFTTRFMTGDVAGYTWQARNLGVGDYGIEHIGDVDQFNGLDRVGTRMPWQGGFESIFPRERFSVKHPEFYPLVDGTRKMAHDSQLCFTNPEMIRQYIAKFDEVMKNAPARVRRFGIGHGDNWEVCQCAGCMRPVTLPGGVVVAPTDEDFRSVQYFRFVNQVAEMAAAKHPGKTVWAYAYLWSAQSPRLKLADNVKIQYCPYVKDHKVPITHPINKKWLDRFTGWPDACGHVRLYEYYLCYTTPLFYNPVCDIAAQDVRFYQGKGLKGVYLDVPRYDSTNSLLMANFPAADAYSASAPEFWVAMRLMWDPAQDVEKLRDEFCRRAYREAAAPMRAYAAMIREVWLKDQTPCYWNDNPVMAARRYIVGNNLEKPLRALLEKAAAQAVHPGSKELIKRNRQVFEKWLELEKKIGKKLEVPVPGSATPPETDFTLSKGDWANAAVIDGFQVMNQPDQPAESRTEVKLLHDKQNLYIGFRCTEKEMEKVKESRKVTPRDVWLSSPYYVEMFFDGDQREKGGYYHVCFDVNGSSYDALGYDEKWSGEWEVKTAKLDDCWVAIIKLPLKTIGMNISMGNKLGVMFCRSNGTSWCGGNVHQAAGFQDLILKMD